MGTAFPPDKGEKYFEDEPVNEVQKWKLSM
jgi:hypothetical protein